MKLSDTQKNWEAFATIDPMWAILTDQAKKGGKWDKTEFFKSGEKDINAVVKYLESRELIPAKDKALDFGCGMGRLTLGLAAHFKELHGIDISEEMIRLANEHNAYPFRVNYHVNQKSDLSQFKSESFDFVFTLITLQHIHPDYSIKYIEEFLRLLKPGGIAYFQVPEELKLKELLAAQKYTGWRKWGAMLPAWLLMPAYKFYQRRAGAFPKMEMHGIPRKKIFVLAAKYNCEVKDILPNDYAGEFWISNTYVLRKKS